MSCHLWSAATSRWNARRILITESFDAGLRIRDWGEGGRDDSTNHPSCFPDSQMHCPWCRGVAQDDLARVDEMLGREWLNDSSRHTARTGSFLSYVGAIVSSTLFRSADTACSYSSCRAVHTVYPAHW